MCGILKKMKKKHPSSHPRRGLVLVKVFLFLLVFVSGLAAGYFFHLKQGEIGNFRLSKEDVYIAFSAEVYDKIKENYWEKIPDEQLSNLFQLGAEKLTNFPLELKSKDKNGVKALIARVTKEMDENKKKEFILQLTDIVLANLKPLGRSRLYTVKLEQDLRNTVSNIDPSVDQYQVLGVKKDASEKEIEVAYEKKVAEEPENLAQINRAYEALNDSENRELYDAAGIEPTMSYRLIRPTIFYLYIKKFSPTTFEELKRVTEKVDDREGLDILLLDLQDNIGGAIDGLPYFLGSFIGQDQYAYQFFHQNEKTDFKTKTGWLPGLVRYKKVVILINGGTQSSAEVMAATLKKYNVGVLVGTTSKGWGTVENTFSIEQRIDPDEKYSLFLVHSLALGDDSQPIEGKGVDPIVDVTDPAWESQLNSYFNYPELIEAVKEVLRT